MRKVSDLKGFTLIEILIVIGLIAVLAAVTIIALNPTASFVKTRDSERNSELAQLHTAMNRMVADNNGSTAGMTSGGNPVPTCAATVLAAHGVNFRTTSVYPTLTFLGLIPTNVPVNDPVGNADYKICNPGGGVYTLFAPVNEGTLVTMTR